MDKIIHLLLACLFLFGCSKTSTPVQVTGPVKFGGYEVSPPYGYWYAPKKKSIDFHKPNYFAIVTFWKNKKAGTLRDFAPTDEILFFNFSISENKYDNFAAYYDAIKQFNVVYSDLSNEEEALITIPNWSCKRTVRSLYGIECISLGDDLLTIGVFGNDQNKVTREILQLKEMIGSLRALKK